MKLKSYILFEIVFLAEIVKTKFGVVVSGKGERNNGATKVKIMSFNLRKKYSAKTPPVTLNGLDMTITLGKYTTYFTTDPVYKSYYEQFTV